MQFCNHGSKLLRSRNFLGLTGFYRKFIKHYATLAAPLTDLLQNHKFRWTELAQQAFEKLKLHMTQMPTLHLPDFKLPFVVETDAFAVAVGAVLSQNGHPLAFFSKKMNPKLQASSVYVREMYAITESVKRVSKKMASVSHRTTFHNNHR